MGMITSKTRKIINLHQKGMSTSEIAKVFSMKKNSVIALLRFHKKLRKNLGNQCEMDMFNYFKKQGLKVKRMRGDYPFDFNVDGVRIDVKGANKIKNTLDRYSFDLQHKHSIKRKTKDHVDKLFLVFLDQELKPIYELDFSLVEHLKSNLKVKYSKPKYPMKLFGYLEKS